MYLRESHTNYYSFKGKENKVSVAIPIIYVMYRLSNYGTKPTVVIFSQKSKNITAKILEYTPFSPSGKFLAAENWCPMNYHHRWWPYKHAEQPRLPLAINTPAWPRTCSLELRPCGAGVFCRVRALFLQMIKESFGQSPLKKEIYMNLESVIQRQVSQKEKNKYCILTYMCEI